MITNTASRKASALTRLELGLALPFLAIAILGAALQIAHVARPLGSLVVFLGVCGNTVIVLRNAGRVHRGEDPQRVLDRALE